MKKAKSQWVRSSSFILCGLVFFAFLSLSPSYLSQGEGLFKAKCATCHAVFQNGTGPKLYGAVQRWEDAGEGDLIYEWVRNNAALRASGKSKRAAEVFAEYKGSVMTVFADLTDDQIKSIFDWVDTQDPAAAGGGGGNIAAADALEEEEEGGIPWTWIILGVMFVIIIMAVSGVRRQLKIATKESEPSSTSLTYIDEFKIWAWKYRLYVGLTTLVLVLSVIVALFQTLYSVNIMENYQPSQPIAFPHSVHAGINGIDCKYCHNSVTKSKSAGIPSVNVCMNCHKKINGEGKEFQGEINKIYAAAGWDPNKGPAGEYTGVTDPIVWNKVHNLPDHVYFNHSQHVVVGGLDCKQCHGDMAKLEETAKVQPHEALNLIQENIDAQVKFTKPTLTMGWCIECHGQYSVNITDGKSGYYEEIHNRLKNNNYSLLNKYTDDGKVTVKELGGWECSKCHY
jgi:mono/diheme cytochrome c family protein